MPVVTPIAARLDSLRLVNMVTAMTSGGWVERREASSRAASRAASIITEPPAA
jgi:hypothetical protein